MSSFPPPPGRLLDIGTHRLHLIEMGAGNPPVILETGGPGIPLGWSFVQPEVARFTRVVSYDRAGIGWSDPGPRPRTGQRIVAELRALLRAAGIEPPYVLVGGSFGGHYVRLYAHQHPEEVAGLVLADASHEDMGERGPAAWRRQFPMMQKMVGALGSLARWGVLRLLGARLPIYSILFHEGLTEAQRAMMLAHFTRAAQWEGMQAEVENYQGIEAEVRTARAAQPTFGDLPLVVLTAGGTWNDPKMLPPGIKPGQLTPLWLELQRDLASLSTNSTHIVAEEMTHVSMLGPAGVQPVAEAIRKVINSQ